MIKKLITQYIHCLFHFYNKFYDFQDISSLSQGFKIYTLVNDRLVFLKKLKKKFKNIGKGLTPFP